MLAAADVLCDASVVLKWFHAEGEEEVEASRALLDLHRTHGLALSVLDLTAYEVGNALLRGLGVGAEKVSAVLGALEVICPRVALTPTELSDAAILAEGHHLTMYDAAYAAGAKSRHAELATLDRALLQAGLGRRPSEILADRR
ncbi:MAG: type II toxin-antitoxin system VapC family toxin [Candidatus Limnocylindrales bacterium]